MADDYQLHQFEIRKKKIINKKFPFGIIVPRIDKEGFRGGCVCVCVMTLSRLRQADYMFSVVQVSGGIFVRTPQKKMWAEKQQNTRESYWMGSRDNNRHHPFRFLFLETSQMFIADHQTNAPKEKIGLLFFCLFVFVFPSKQKKKQTKKRYDKLAICKCPCRYIIRRA